jgi:hypothetical protein
VVTEFVSIDGVFEDPGGSENYEHGGWWGKVACDERNASRRTGR